MSAPARSDQPIPVEPWTPIQVERKLAELMNGVASAEIAMRDLLEQESKAKYAYERAHVIASTDPNCPVVGRGAGQATVGERDSWIRGMCEDEYQGLLYAELNVTIQRSYMKRLEQQCSLVQTMAKMVLGAYQVAGSRERGGYLRVRPGTQSVWIIRELAPGSPRTGAVRPTVPLDSWLTCGGSATCSTGSSWPSPRAVDYG